MYIMAGYNYKGSMNCSLTFVEGAEEGSIDLMTDYGEKIATVHDTSELMEVLNKLDRDEY